MSSKLTEWRKTHHTEGLNGSFLEALARDLNLPDGFEVRPKWPGLDWVEFGKDGEKNSIPHFRRLVEAAAAVLGSPDSVNGEHWVGAHDGAPDLIARWKVPVDPTEDWKPGMIEVTVRILSPVGCSIKPGTAFREAETPELHPECVHALAELEEL